MSQQHASFQTAGWRWRLFARVCLLAVIHFSCLSLNDFVLAAETSVIEPEAAVAEADLTVNPQESPVADNENPGEAAVQLEEGEIPVPETENRVTDDKEKRMKWIKASALAASVMLFLFFYIRTMAKGRAEEQKRLEMTQSLAKFAASLLDLRKDLVQGSDLLAETTKKVNALISQIDEKIVTTVEAAAEEPQE